MAFALLSSQLKTGIGNPKQDFAGRLNITDWITNKMYPSGHDDSMDLDHWDHEQITGLMKRMKGWLKDLLDSFVNELKQLAITLLSKGFNLILESLFTRMMDSALGKSITAGISTLQALPGKIGAGLLNKMMDALGLNKPPSSQDYSILIGKEDAYSTTLFGMVSPANYTYSKNGPPAGNWTAEPTYSGKDIEPFAAINFYESLASTDDSYSVAMQHLYQIEIDFPDQYPAFFDNNKYQPYLGRLNYFTSSVTLPNVEIQDMGEEHNEFGYMNVTSGKLLPDKNTFNVNFLDTDIPIFEYLIYPWQKEIAGNEYAYEDYPYSKATVTVNYFKLKEGPFQKDLSTAMSSIYSKSKDLLSFYKMKGMMKPQTADASIDLKIAKVRNEIQQEVDKLNKNKKYTSFVQYQFTGVIPQSFITRDPAHTNTSDITRSVSFQFENMTINRDFVLSNENGVNWDFIKMKSFSGGLGRNSGVETVTRNSTKQGLTGYSYTSTSGDLQKSLQEYSNNLRPSKLTTMAGK